MDVVIAAAGRALAVGDPLAALKLVALRDDAPALALRGIAMAQLGDLVRAKALLARAARAFGPRDVVARARCVVAQAEVALAARNLQGSAKVLHDAGRALEARGDRINGVHARVLEVRWLLLIGRLDEAEQKLRLIDPRRWPAALAAAHQLSAAGIAMRRLRSKDARTALVRAGQAARAARIPALLAEVAQATQVLAAPAARVITRGSAGVTPRPVPLAEVESVLASKALVVDACRFVVRQERKVIPLARRPVLFALARALGEAWPADVPRDVLVQRAFHLKLRDESHRARLRVEMGRLRRTLRPLAGVTATPAGFTLVPRRARQVVVLAPPVEVEERHQATVLALLADGESWSTSALGLALGINQRTVQRALDALATGGKVQPVGRGRARRWMTPPLTGFAPTLLLPAPWAAN